jgi:hypothetical protein
LRFVEEERRALRKPGALALPHVHEGRIGEVSV